MNNSIKRLRGVAVGAGYFSRYHLNAWSRIKDVDLVAVCDLDRDKASQVASEHDIKQVYTDVSEMLTAEQPDFIDIITRPDSHLQIVHAAAAAGVNVICQKPLAPTLEASERLVSAARDGAIQLMVHENFRFQPWYREIRSLLDRGVVGQQLHSIAVRTRTGDGWQADAYQARQPYVIQSAGIFHDLTDVNLSYEIAETAVTDGIVTAGQTILSSGSQIATTNGLEWIDFTFAPLTLEMGKSYHIEFSHTGNGNQNFFYNNQNARFSEGSFAMLDGTQFGGTSNFTLSAIRVLIPEPSAASLAILGLFTVGRRFCNRE